MQYRHPRTRVRLHSIKNFDCRPSTVDGDDPTASRLASRQDVFKNVGLILPLRSKFRAPVQTNLAHIPRLRKQGVEQCQLPFPFAGQLRMQTQGDSNSARVPDKRGGSLPCAWRCRHGEDVEPARDALMHDAFRDRIQIQMTMEIDHRILYACNRDANSARPRFTTPFNALASLRNTDGLSAAPSHASS